MPRAAPAASGIPRQFLAHAPPDQFRKSLAACLPLSPEGTSYSPPDPRIQSPQHRGRFTEPVVAAPTPYIPGQFLHHLLHAPPPALVRDFPYPLFESVYRFRRDFALRLLPVRKAESQKLPLLRFRHRTLRLVHLELQLFGYESLHAFHHPLPRSLAAYVDVAVVRIPHEAVPASLQLPVEFVQHEVTQQRRKWSALGRPFHARTHQPALHHPRIQECPDEFQQPLVRDPLGDLPHQFVVIDSIKEFLQIEINAPAVPFGDVLLRLGYCLLGTPPRSKTVAVFGKRRVPLLL